MTASTSTGQWKTTLRNRLQATRTDGTPEAQAADAKIANLVSQLERLNERDCPVWVRLCDHHGCVMTAPHQHGSR